jgi:hypothetical protein
MKNLRIHILFFLLVALASSCVIEKRHYLKGFYFKRIKKVDTDAQTQNPPTSNNNNPPVNNAPNQQYIPPSQNSTATTPPPKKVTLPTFCVYASLQEGLSALSLNAEKIFCFGPYVQTFARAGVGLYDVSRDTYYKKYIFSGGIAAGSRMLKVGGEIGYGGYFNGNPASGFYDVFIRLIPGRKSVYLSASYWRAMNVNEKMQSGAACGLGISF